MSTGAWSKPVSREDAREFCLVLADFFEGDGDVVGAEKLREVAGRPRYRLARELTRAMDQIEQRAAGEYDRTGRRPDGFDCGRIMTVAGEYNLRATNVERRGSSGTGEYPLVLMQSNGDCRVHFSEHLPRQFIEPILPPVPMNIFSPEMPIFDERLAFRRRIFNLERDRAFLYREEQEARR